VAFEFQHVGTITRSCSFVDIKNGKNLFFITAFKIVT
jgi:hypothetical protein